MALTSEEDWLLDLESGALYPSTHHARQAICRRTFHELHMTSDIYRGLIRALEGESKAVAERALTSLLASNGEHAASLAEEWVPFILELPDGDGQRAAIDLVGPYADGSPMVLAFVLSLAGAPYPRSRISALNAFIRVPNDLRVRAKLTEMLADDDVNVRDAAIGKAQLVLSAMADPVATGVLRVLPDPSQAQAALDLLDELERAVKRLQDIGGLDDGQRLIIDDIVLATINELRSLFSGTAETSEDLRDRRLLSILTLGRVMGAAKGLALATTTLASADKASANVAEVVEHLEPVFHLITSLM